MKKIVFMGSDAIALPLLEAVYARGRDRYMLEGVMSQPDRPSGRGKQVTPNAVSAWAMERGVTILRPEKPSEVELRWLRESGVDLVLVMAYGHILRKEFLDTPPLGMLNFHASLLPAYRGCSPVEAAIASGDEVTGVTLMQMVEKMDAGGILDQETVRIEEDDTSESLRENLGDGCVPLLFRNLPTILGGKCVFRVQDETEVTYTRKIKKVDGWLDFNASALELSQRIRAMEPWPGSYFKQGGIAIKVGRCGVVEGVDGGYPGLVVGTNERGLLVATGKGVLGIGEMQRPGGRMMFAGEFLRGYPLPEGTLLGGHPMEPLVSREPFAKRKKGL